ncbi:MAG: hypothetical protein H7257_04130 [Taibaiella sp.]|nr:hypothetical protein [Taibaiella sp.]
MLLVLAVFIAFKIPHLFYAYYWDESWPYVPAILEMFRNGVSLLPTAIDAELSRGHPLFFHAAGALWIHIFGSSHVAMHSFALLISVLFLIVIFEACLRLFNVRVAVISLLLVVTQELFFVQSSFVLFEILVAFLAFSSIFLYVRGRYLPAFLCLTMLFYTKESGLVVGAVLGIDSIFNLFNKDEAIKLRWFRLASVAGACAMIGVFFLLQKLTRGWYVFPLYTDTLLFHWNDFWFRFRMNSIRDTFDQNSQYRVFVGLLLLAVVAAVKNSSYKYLALFLPALCIYYFVENVRAESLAPGYKAFILFACGSIFFLLVYSTRSLFAHKQQRRFILLSGIFILLFLNFSTLAYFSSRYLVVAIIPVLVLTAIFFDMLLNNTYKALYYPLLLLIVATGYNSFKHSTGHGDIRLGAFKALTVQQRIVQYMEDNNYYGKKIYSISFLTREHLADPATGFLKSATVFPFVSTSLGTDTDFAIFDNIEADENYDRFRRDSSMKLIYRTQEGDVWSEIYQKAYE